MLLYLTGDENNGIFDFLGAPEHGNLHIKKYIGAFDLQTYLVQTLRNVIGIYDFIAIDLQAIKNKEEEILETLKQFLVMFDRSRIIVFANGRGRGDRLIMDMVNIGIYNILTGNTVDELRSEIQAAVSMEGMSYAEASEKFYISGEKKQEIEKYFVSQQNKNLIVTVAGTAHGAGATHTAFNLLSFLHSTNAKCAYCDGNNKGDLKTVAGFFPDFVRRDYFWEHQGCHFYGFGDIVKESYDFLVIDLGVLSENHAPYLQKAAISILCAKTKPWELLALNEKKGLILPGKSDLLYLFGSQANQRQLELAAGDTFKAIHFAQYAPDLWDGKGNADVFRKIFGMTIMETASPEAKDKKKKKRLFNGKK